MAYMLGARTAFPLSTEIVAEASFEAALTDPFLYLRGLDGVTGEDPPIAGYSHGYGHDVILKNFNRPGDYKRMFLGYEHGGDAIVLNYSSTLEDVGHWNAYFNGMYMWHGNKRLDSQWSVYGKNGMDDLVSILSGEVIERTLILSVGGKYTIEKRSGLYVKANMDYVNIVNMKSDTAVPFSAIDYGDTVDLYLNEEGSDHSDLQLSLCIGIAL